MTGYCFGDGPCEIRLEVRVKCREEHTLCRACSSRAMRRRPMIRTSRRTKSSPTPRVYASDLVAKAIRDDTGITYTSALRIQIQHDTDLFAEEVAGGLVILRAMACGREAARAGYASAARQRSQERCRRHWECAGCRGRSSLERLVARSVFELGAPPARSAGSLFGPIDCCRWG